jgi:tetratricopeptide (TPR) repeat protein
MASETETGFFAAALAAHQAGDIGRAAELYRRAVAANDLAADALNNLAAIASLEKRFADAAAFLDEALALAPQAALLHANRARTALALGDAAASLAHLDSACKLDAAFADAYFEFGAAFLAAGHPAAAGPFFERTIAAQPSHYDAHLDLGAIRFLEKNFDEARAYFARAIEIKPDSPAARENLAALCVEIARGRRAAADIHAAEIAYREALSVFPGSFDAKVDLAYMLVEHGHPQHGLELYESAFRDRPYRADLLVNLGHACNEMGRFGAAVDYLRRALEIDRGISEAYINLGVSLHGLARFEEAVAQFDAALALSPHSSSAHTSKGNTLQHLGRLEAAVACHMRALELDPSNAQAHFNLGVVHLLGGDYARGWKHYDWRWRIAKYRPKVGVGDFRPRRPDKPEDVAGRTFLVTCEQGFGDSIQFVRYVDSLVRLGAHVTLLAQPALADLFGQIRGIERVVTEIEREVPFDYAASVLDLAGMFWSGVDRVPGRSGYLHAAPARLERWSQILGPKTLPRVGLVWSGSVDHTDDANRSHSLKEFSRLLTSGIDFIALQKDIRPEDRRILDQKPEIRDYSDLIADFSDTAALCQLVDLVVSVDTSVAHLAGAMGRPVQIALPVIPDWRWMMSGGQTHWYGSARLVRQTQRGSWTIVFDAIAAELQALKGSNA